ncbi:low temperature requirement protein A [Sphingosinicella sp.]|uniref:low temperature requirement protein A n=1 Tax=Sphingosinicella sp. TaxID=1917971 RepID=UPI00403816FC
MTRSARHHLLREAGEARVEPVELFFDLVFVFAITQLSHRLIAHPDPRGFVETGLLIVAIWWTWINTAWVTNWLNPGRTRVRLLLFALMGAGLVVSMSIPDAFGARGPHLAIAYVAMELGRSLFMIAANRVHNPTNAKNFLRILCWQAAAGIFFVAGGFAAPESRLWLWAAALAIWTLAPAFSMYVPGLGPSRTIEWRVDPHHMAERCGLFIILALGESILVLGATFAGMPWDGATILAFGAAFAGTAAMWWIYFNIGAERAEHMFRASDDPGRVARLAYTYLHLPIVAGIIVAAAATEWVIAHPHGHAAPYVIAGSLGGPALYLFGNAAFKRATGARYWPLSHLVGLGALAALAPVATYVEPWLLALAVAAVVLTVAVWETLSLGARHRAIRAAHEGGGG